MDGEPASPSTADRSFDVWRGRMPVQSTIFICINKHVYMYEYRETGTGA